MACILIWSSSVRVHDSQAYWKMDVTREHIRRILELREILLSFQTGFNLISAAVACAILESISGFEPSSGITEPRYEKYWTDGHNTALGCTITRPVEIHLYWTVLRQTQRTTPYLSQRSGGCSTITEDREMSWSQQHSSRTGPSRWRGRNRCSYDNMQQDLADRRMANLVNPVLSHHTSQERQPAAVPEQLNNQPHQSTKQSHAADHTEQIEETSEKDHH